MASPLKFLTVTPATKHTATVIFVHGLGDSGWGWEPVAKMIKKDPALDHIKWVLPHAFRKSITANNGMVMPAWFDIKSFDTQSAEDEDGMLESSEKIKSLIMAEIASGTPSDRIVLGGFSQGGAMTLLTGTTLANKLGGLVVMSGWLPIREKVKAMVSEHAKTLPIFWGHGDEDPLVNIKRATNSRDFLKSDLSISDSSDVGSPGLSFNVYKGMGHAAEVQELEDLKRWLAKTVPKV